MNTSSTAAALSSVQKACRLLAELSDPGPHRLSNLVASTGLNKATAIRLLDTLVDEGFVTRNAQDKSYALGNEAVVMQAAASRHSPANARFRAAARASLERVALATEDSTHLCIPCGSHAVCIDREEGAYPLRANFVQVGRRLPLGVGSAGLALLAWLPDDEVAAMMERNRGAIAHFPRVSEPHILRGVKQARERGYALSSNVVCEGTGGIAVPILDPEGRPIAALSATALIERLVHRRDEVVAQLYSESAAIESSLAHGASSRSAWRSDHKTRDSPIPQP